MWKRLAIVNTVKSVVHYCEQRVVNNGVLRCGHDLLNSVWNFSVRFFVRGSLERDWKIFLTICYSIYVDSLEKFHKATHCLILGVGFRGQGIRWRHSRCRGSKGCCHGNHFWLSIYGVHIGATWWMRLNRPCAAAMRPYVKLLWPLVIIIIMLPSCRIHI